MPIDLNDEPSPIDPNDDKYTSLLANLQGNILKPHGRDYSLHLFLNFTGDAAAVKNWISAFTERYVTTALRQHYESKEFKINQISGRVFAGFYLSAQGYRTLGFNDLEGFKEFEQSDINNGGVPNAYFKYGMEASQMFLGDPDPAEWEAPYRARQIHALVVLADHEKQRLSDVRARIENSLNGVANIIAGEHGFVLRDEAKKAIEHFGYRDGISQPLFYKTDVDDVKDKKFWNPSAPLKLVLTRDPLAGDDGDHFGSYLVFRKLEQDIDGFNETIGNLAREIGISGNEILAGAMAVGRFKNGTPVILSETIIDGDAADTNDFIYTHAETNQPNSNKCPFHAHIRKTNPRGDTGFEGGQVNQIELDRRIARRGIPYSEPDSFDPQAQKHGLLFMCFQNSIPRQFGFIQIRWANDTTFFENNVGIDPIIGKFDSDDNPGGGSQRWFPKWGGDAEQTTFSVADFVKMKGGEFFFAPSIEFLRKLAQSE